MFLRQIAVCQNVIHLLMIVCGSAMKMKVFWLSFCIALTLHYLCTQIITYKEKWHKKTFLRKSFRIVRNTVSFSPQVIFMMAWVLSMTMVRMVLNWRITSSNTGGKAWCCSTKTLWASTLLSLCTPPYGRLQATLMLSTIHWLTTATQRSVTALTCLSKTKSLSTKRRLRRK